MIYSVIECIDKSLLLSCHDISDGGMLVTLAEMILGGNADGQIGANVDLNYPDLRNDKILFSESPGFVIEVENKNIKKVEPIFKKYKLITHKLGKTTKKNSLTIINNNEKIIDLSIEKLKNAWTSGFEEALE